MDKVEERVREIRERCEKATPFVDSDVHRYEHGGGRVYVEELGARKLIADFYDEANREFFANCREDVPFLLDALLASERSREWIKVTPETMPPERTLVDVCGMKRLERAMAYRIGDEWLIETCSDNINIYPPKYWRNLDALPSEGE